MPGPLVRIYDRLATGCLFRLFSGAVAVGFIWLTWYLLVKADLGCCNTVLILGLVFVLLKVRAGSHFLPSYSLDQGSQTCACLSRV